MVSFNTLNKQITRGCAVLAAFVVPMSFVTSAHATSYPNVIGNDVTYLNINENDSQIVGNPPVTSSPTGLFGAPVIDPVGSDNLSFPALTFGSIVASGQFELQDGKLSIDMSSNNLSTGSITSLNFDEGGAFRVDGPTSGASSEATLIINNVRITSIDGTALLTPIVVPFTSVASAPSTTGAVTVATNPGDITLTSAGANAFGTWEIDDSFNLLGALAGAGEAGQRITGLSIDLNNQLFTQTTDEESGALTLAQIDKKHFDVLVGTGPVVPEPASFSLLACGSALMFRRNRRGKSLTNQA